MCLCRRLLSKPCCLHVAPLLSIDGVSIDGGDHCAMNLVGSSTATRHSQQPQHFLWLLLELWINIFMGAPQISSHRVIYHLLEEVKSWAQALTPKVEKEVVSGEADVLQV